MNRRFHGIRSRRALLRSGWIAAWIAACIALPILIGACLLADEGSGEEQDLAQSEPSHHDDGPDPFKIAERLGIDPAEAAWVQMREKHYFHSLEDMVAVADTVVVGRVVGLEEGRVLVPDDDYGQPAFETAIAEIEVERAMLGAAEGEILEVEFERWIFETEDDGSVSRYRMIRSDLANEYEVGERGIYALGRFDEGGPLESLNHQARMLLVAGQVEIVHPETAIAELRDATEAEAIARVEESLDAAERADRSPQ